MSTRIIDNSVYNKIRNLESRIERLEDELKGRQLRRFVHTDEPGKAYASAIVKTHSQNKT